MLSKDDVDRMVHEAAEHADEDRRRREEVETRNQADTLAYQAERVLRDLADKVTPEDRAAVESGIESVREALKGDDLEAIRARASELAERLQKVGAAAYQQAGATEAGGGGGESGDGEPGGPGEAAGSPGEPGEADEAVEGEYKEV
jgi:molecular chaperone DnaK